MSTGKKKIVGKMKERLSLEAKAQETIRLRMENEESQ